MDSLSWKKGICGICPAGCWIEGGFDGEKLVEVKEDASHSLGMMCHRGKHSSDMIYSENRLKYPMRRKGPKGTLDFERITWEEAYQTIVENLNKIKEESGPEAVSIYTGRGAFELSLCDIFQPKGVAVSSASSVLFPFGSPNTMGVGALCYVSYAMMAPHVTMGRMLVNMFTDIESANLLLVWGTNPATDSPPLDILRLEAAKKRGAEIIVIDPRKTETVFRTEAEWIPIRPGTDGALALGMLNVMIEDSLYNEDFAENWCHGFEELKTYVQHFNPEYVESITGVPADTLITLTHKICNATSAAPVMYTGLEYSNSGIQAIRAVFTVFALADHLDSPGGIGLAMPDTHFPINRDCNVENPDIKNAVARDKFPLYSEYRGESHASGLIDSVLKEDPYKIRGLIIHGASLLTSWPQTSLWREALSKLDFQVTIDRQLTADSAYADIVLPATTMYEITSYMVYGPIFRVRERMVEPQGEARNDYLIMAQLAKELGYGEQYPQSEEELLDYVLKDSGYTAEDIREQDGWVKLPTPLMEYKKWEKGLLRKDGKPGFDTPTGKFEIWSTIMEDYGYEPLPKYTEPTEGPLASPDKYKTYPLVFNSGARIQTDFRSQHHGIDKLVSENPEPVIEMNPADAEPRNIVDGDLVEVSTARGSVPFRAAISENIVPGSIECNMGGGSPVGPKSWREWNVNELTDLGNYDEVSGFPVYKALLCEVKKAEGENRKRPSNANNCFESQVAERQVITSKVYLDNNATTALEPEVREAMLPFYEQYFGNASSIHHEGKETKLALDKARRQVARLLNTLPGSITFTGGGSEGANLAIKGIAFANRGKGNHIITSSIEHPAVLNTCKFLAKQGFDITVLEVDEFGIISPEQLAQAITDQTILVSIMMINNEVGTQLPIKALCEVARQNGVLFHTDAVQAVGKVEVDTQDLNVDVLSLSGHKFHGPKGVGAMYCKKSVHLEPLIHGGNQEKGLRAGTENIAGIVGLGKAAELAQMDLKNASKIAGLRNTLEAEILKLVPGCEVNGHPTQRAANTLNMTLPDMRGESVVLALSQKGIALSSGSACKSGSTEPTHVLIAMGKTPEEAHCSIRFSLSKQTTEEDIQQTVEAFKEVIKEMESAVRFLPCK